MTSLICDCNKTMSLDGPGLIRALGPDAGDGLQTVHSTLCRREAAAFQRAAKSPGELLVACTQESRLFLELAEQTEGAPGLAERPIRFVNIRESGGWSKDAKAALPKIAALLAVAQLAGPEPVPVVGYRSAGRVLVIGTAERGVRAARLLEGKLEVSLLLERPGGRLPQERTIAVHSGSLTRLSGWLGAFEARWTSSNPIDMDLCTRCNACIEVCPELAIDFSYQIDLGKCKSHRDCQRACEAAGAIDFERKAESTTETFDLVLDLGEVPAFAMHQPPQGYFRAADDAALVAAALELRDSVGEFEKPRFFDYRQSICAHSRNEQIGCSACIDVCSAEAIRSDGSHKGRTSGGGIVVEPHLCVGCGACTTVCPSGAISYATPRPNEMGTRIRTLLATYARTGGAALAGPPALLVHSAGAGAKVIGELGRAARVDPAIQGIPARVLPLEVWHTASVGIDLWLAAIAFGASQVWVMMTDEEAPEYRDAITAQMQVAEAILAGLGLAGEHFRITGAGEVARAIGPAPSGPADPSPTPNGRTTHPSLLRLDRALQRPAAAAVQRAATFAVQANKRATLDLAIDHLMREASRVPDAVALPEASPFGNVVVDTAACTLCMACVGACPEAALADSADRPQLRFIETNCVQCGLCETTCPENAITLAPRLLLADGGKARKAARVLHEVEPFCCVRCGKPFTTAKAIEVILGKLAGHAMFQGAAAKRLQMCSDCRVIDMHGDAAGEVRITDL
jgi:ferredoxin